MIRHIVIWTLKATEAQEKAAAIDRICTVLGSLPPLVPQIKHLRVAHNVAHHDVNQDVVLVVDFDSVADLDAYQEHPEHVKIVPVVRELTSARAAVDFEVL